MKILKCIFVGLLLGNAVKTEAKKPVTLKLHIAAMPRMNVAVQWGDESRNTNGNGEVTFQRRWYQKRSKGKRIRLKITWHGKDPLLSYFKDTTIVLSESNTMVDCPHERLRRLEEATRREQAELQRNLALLVPIEKLELRLVQYLKIHPESLVLHYEKWLKERIEAIPQHSIQKTIHRLETLKARLFENDVLERDAQTEINNADTLGNVVNPPIQEMEKMLPEIIINLDNAPDEDLRSDISFDPGKDSLKSEAKEILSKYATKKLNQIQKMFVGEGSSPRERICILSFTGYADSAPMSPLSGNTAICPPSFQDKLDGNLCLSWRRANEVKKAVVPLFEKGIKVDAKEPVGMGKQYASKDTNQEKTHQDGWRKCTISAIYMSKKFAENAKLYVDAPQTNKN